MAVVRADVVVVVVVTFMGKPSRISTPVDNKSYIVVVEPLDISIY